MVTSPIVFVNRSKMNNKETLDKYLVKKVLETEGGDVLVEGLANLFNSYVQCVLYIGKRIQPLIQSTYDYLQANPEILKNIVNTLRTLSEKEPYFKIVLDELSNPNLKFSAEVIYFSEFIFKYEGDIDDFSILNLVKEDYFRDKVLESFSNIDLPNQEKRFFVLNEIFNLTQSSFFAGAIVLLYGQLEGLLTDFLINQKLLSTSLEYKYENFNYLEGSDIKSIYSYEVCRDGFKKYKTKKKIIGLNDKILIAKNFYPEFESLSAYRIDPNASNKKISNSRNDVLHGSDLDNFTVERVFILSVGFVAQSYS